MLRKFSIAALAGAALLFVFSCGENPDPVDPVVDPEPQEEGYNDHYDPDYVLVPDRSKAEIRDGKFYQDGHWVLIKAAKPLCEWQNAAQCLNFVTNILPVLKRDGFNVVELNCYWHLWDTKNSDGVPEGNFGNINYVIDEIVKAGMYPCLSLETYAVGGGSMPAGFFEKYPDSRAIDSEGKYVADDEYGFGNPVVSLFDDDYIRLSREFIKNMVKGIHSENILYYETTVEPQYMGNRRLDFTESAKKKYNEWRVKNGITTSDSELPDASLVGRDKVNNWADTNPDWNRFKAQYLASWVNGDAEAFRSVAGKDAWVATDFLFTTEGAEMARRDGDPKEFLLNLSAPDILQVNWHWHLGRNLPNQPVYDCIKAAQDEGARKDWAITEHMTLNGNNFNSLSEEQLGSLIDNTIANSTHFGWEFASTTLSGSNDPNNKDFALYYGDWQPKVMLKYFLDHYDETVVKTRENERLRHEQ